MRRVTQVTNHSSADSEGAGGKNSGSTLTDRMTDLKGKQQHLFSISAPRFTRGRCGDAPKRGEQMKLIILKFQFGKVQIVCFFLY